MNITTISKNMENEIYKKIADFLQVSEDQLHLKDDLILDFKINSFDLIHLLVFLEESYNIRYDMMKYNSLLSVSSIVRETMLLVK